MTTHSRPGAVNSEAAANDPAGSKIKSSVPDSEVSIEAWLARLNNWEPTPEAIAACQRIGRLLGGAA